MIGLPARIIVFSYRIYFELNPAGGLPNYGGAAAVVAAVHAVRRRCCCSSTTAPIRRAESFVTVTGKAYRQRRLALGALARPRAAVRAALPRDGGDRAGGWCCSGPASSATRCRRARPRPTSAPSRTGQLFANPAFWTGLKQHRAGRGRLGRDRDRDRRRARLDHLALGAAAAARCSISSRSCRSAFRR